MQKQAEIIVTLAILLVAVIGLFSATQKQVSVSKSTAISSPATKLDWFIPDGFRADPNVFNIYKWADEGLLPNIKYLMDHGSYGYSIPVFPGHTPANFAALLTGSYPVTNGVADGPMRAAGAPLATPSVKGFSSTARKVPAVWTLMENDNKSVVLLSMPGSTPPELKKGITIEGRWGGWGFDTPAMIFDSANRSSEILKIGTGRQLFYLGANLTQITTWSKPYNWSLNYSSSLPAEEIDFDAYGGMFYGLVVGNGNYTNLLISLDKRTIVENLTQGEWSKWIPITLNWQGINVSSNFKVVPILINADGSFRIRVLYDNLNKFMIDPSSAYGVFHNSTGPMVDFVDNYPAQLIYEPQDKQIFLQEANMSIEWHKNADKAVYNDFNPDVFIHDIYTPNQMLTSRWWMGPYMSGNKTAQAQVLAMYQGIDSIIGEDLKHWDNNTLFVLSSDHGAVELNRSVYLNNYFAQKGWLNFTVDPSTGDAVINWSASKVVFLKMDSIYVNPNGLGGNWTRASGPAYEKLRNQVIDALYELNDSGIKPVASAVRWEDAGRFLDLPADRVGDIVVANIPGYGWSEAMDANLTLFSDPLVTGYKQAIFPGEDQGMWTPFMIMGHGVKANNFISQPISHVDQLPTILKLMNMTIPSYVQGMPVEAVFKNN